MEVKIEKGRRVRIQVRLAIVDGDELEKNVVEYFQGRGMMLAGLEKVLEGLEKGAKKKGVIKAAEAFGDPDKQISKQLTRKDFPEGLELEEGSQFMAKGADNQQDVVIRVVKIDGDDIEAKLMHPLADKDIEYEFEVLSVTDPMPPPLPGDAIILESADDEDEGESKDKAKDESKDKAKDESKDKAKDESKDKAKDGAKSKPKKKKKKKKK